MTAGAVCLGVTRSAAGKTWRFRLGDETRASDIARRHAVPDLLARILAGRSVDETRIASHFDASLRAWMPDPSTLADLDAAASRIADAIVADEPCTVFGDYDVDGGASSALLLRYFRSLGRFLRLYIPDRMVEGYGPNPTALRNLAAEGVRLVITVDCGAQAFDALEAARDAGLDVIVADHHMMAERAPHAFAIVNPNRPADESGLGHLCAAGVTFMLLVGINRELRRRNWFSATTKEPDLRQYLDLVALATICDVVPLTGLNRAFVNQGLKQLQAGGGSAGLVALRNIAGLKGPIRASHFGFALGPRVNAGGRVGRADLGALLLSTDDPNFAAKAALELDRYNRERQAIEAEVLERATAQLRAEGVGEGLAAAHGDGWHPGVIGIVAGRLKDRFDLPAAVFALDDTSAKASLRSVSGVDVGGAVTAAREEGLLTSGGGHRMAAALSAPRENLADVIAFLNARLAPEVAARQDRGLYAIDAVAGPQALTEGLHDMVERAGPFGAGNPEPVFAVPDACIVNSQIVGENHSSVVVMCGNARLKAIAFRAANTEVGAALARKGSKVHLAGRLLLNEWQGERRVELSIEDVAPVTQP
ncbi:MAG: single-stranded-DNA-specific exonuclease RecJ [Alphaproteobacteria bacterium]|nr:single-stranded-DNA-specific exonuclease RecJ [Alphaproteobacteria bacterium]